MSTSGSTFRKKEKKGARFPPKRGQVKARMYEKLCNLVISAFSKAEEPSKRDLLRTIPQVQLKHVMRESNMAADAIAKKGALAPHGFHNLFDCPPDVNLLCVADLVGVCYTRSNAFGYISSSLPKKKRERSS